MKTLFSLFLFAAFSTFAIAQETNTEKKGKFEWEKTIHEFGEISQNKPVSAKFTFKNTGTAPIIITRVSASCGCSVADFSKGAIPPGASDVIVGTFNAQKLGTFFKTFTVHSNLGEPYKLKIKGQVIKEKK